MLREDVRNHRLRLSRVDPGRQWHRAWRTCWCRASSAGSSSCSRWMEEYAADFATLLATWQAAGSLRQNSQPIDIARLLGWTEGKRHATQMNAVARACSS